MILADTNILVPLGIFLLFALTPILGTIANKLSPVLEKNTKDWDEIEKNRKPEPIWDPCADLMDADQYQAQLDSKR